MLIKIRKLKYTSLSSSS